ncbi:MAG: response regulator [Dehalococcoidaceae bacterium]|nr:response regulator [Dehalococcoidaceae bacterium]
MDIRMPGMSGRELYARLNQAGPGIAGRVAVITGDTSDAGTRAFLREHNLPFIAKPFGREQLLEKVNEVLGSSQNSDINDKQ